MSVLQDARRAALALAAGGVLLGGCLGGDSGAPVRAAGGPQLSAPIRLADCRDWHAGTIRERYGTIEQIRKFSGGPSGSPAGHGPTMRDSTAYKLFEARCKPSFAGYVKLYKLYARAAAFGVR